MKTFAFILKLVAILRPVLKEIVKAIKAVNILKRAMKQEWDANRLQTELNKFFSYNEHTVEVAIAAILVTIHSVAPEFYDKERGNSAITTIINFLKLVAQMPKHERRATLRELARDIIIKRNPERIFDDAELDTLLQLGYSKVKGEEGEQV